MQQDVKNTRDQMNTMLKHNQVWAFSGKRLEVFEALSLDMDLFDEMHKRITDEDFDYSAVVYEEGVGTKSVKTNYWHGLHWNEEGNSIEFHNQG